MRVVDVTSFFSATCGGIKRYYREKARVLPGRGFDCHFVVPGARRGESALGDGTLHALPGPSIPFSREYRLFSPGSALGELLRRLRPDVIEVGSHYLLPSMVRAAVRPLGAHRPAVVGFFHTDFPRQLVQPVARRLLPGGMDDAAVTLAWRFVRRQFGRYDATLVASREIAAQLQTLGVPRVHWVGLGVDTDVFCPGAGARPAGPPVVTYAGRFSPEKELDLLTAVWDDVHQRTGARLRLIGNGPSRAALLRFAAQRPSVSVEAYLDGPNQVAAALAGSDVVVLTSGTETFSLTTAEALSCATPVVGPARGAVGEFIRTSGAGATFAPGSAPALCQALCQVLSADVGERRRLGQLGRANILHDFTWDSVATRLSQAYRAVAQA